MLRFSIPVGRVLGIDLRVHLSFFALLAISVGFSIVYNGDVARGLGLWLAMCFAVLVREFTRAIAASYVGLQLRAVFLLPVGGLMAFTTRDGHAPSSHSSLLRWAGPLANFLVGLLILGSSYALEPHVSLLLQPWIGTGHILRSFVWLQIVLGAVSLLPLPSTSSRDSVRTSTTGATEGNKPAKSGLIRLPAFGFGTALALGMILCGFVLMNLWLIILGAFMLLAAQISSASSVSTTDAESMLVRQIMLTEYTLLSSSDTLQGALDRTVHSLQDVFPVVRGDRLVGSIARQTIAQRLLTDGDSYLQGAMTRSLQLAAPTEKLVDALRRAATLGASEFIPVVEDGAMIGILTPQSLGRAVQQVKLSTPRPTRENARD